MNGVAKWKLVLYLAAIFAAGAVSGWVIAAKTAKQKAFTAPRSDEISASLRDRLHAKLNLSDEQKQKIDAVLERSSKEMQAIHKAGIDRIRQALSNRTWQISAVLTADQQRQFEQIERERQEASRGTNVWRGKGRWRDRSDGPRDRNDGPRDRGERERERERVTNSAPDSLLPRKP